MAKQISIYNEIIKLDDTLLMFSGNVPRDNLMLREQTAQMARLSVDILVACNMALNEPDLGERLSDIRRLKVLMVTIDAIVQLWYNMPKHQYTRNHPITITFKQYGIYCETYHNIISSVKKWEKHTLSQMSEEPKPVVEGK